MRVIKPLGEKNNAYRLVDFIGKKDDYIKNSKHSSILVNYESLIGHIDLLEHIMEIKEITQINCTDYKSAIVIENDIKNNCIPLALIDDCRNKDRSYIDLKHFKRHHLSIPINYVMWHSNIKDDVNIKCFSHITNKNMFSANGDEVLDKETLIKIREIIKKMRIPKDDIEKCIMISNYLQSKVQFVEGKESKCGNKLYITDQNIDSNQCNLVKNLLNNNYGLCMAIANTTTLLLNNPWMNINIRSVASDSHVWNVVKIDDEYYYIDNTWCITKNPNQISNTLKAKSFSDKYLLYGQEMNDTLDNHNPITCLPGIISEENIYPRPFNKAKRKVKRKHSFNYDNTIPIKTHVKDI